MTEMPGPASEHREMDHVLRRRRRRAIRGLLILALIVLVFAFVIQNSQRVTVHFWFFTHKARLIWVVLTCLVVRHRVGLRCWACPSAGRCGGAARPRRRQLREPR